MTDRHADTQTDESDGKELSDSQKIGKGTWEAHREKTLRNHFDGDELPMCPECECISVPTDEGRCGSCATRVVLE